MAELWEGAALGAVFGELLKVVIDTGKKVVMFQSQLHRMETFLISIKPTIEDIINSNSKLGCHEKTTSTLVDLLTKANELVLQCPAVQSWNAWKRLKYTNKLLKMEESLLSFFQMNVPGQLLSDVKKARVELGDIKALAEGVRDNSNKLGRLEMLLSDGVFVVLVSASGGSGKITLRGMLSHDDQIKAKAKNSEPGLYELCLGELLKVWRIRDSIAEGEHPRSTAFMLEYKSTTSSFINHPVNSIPEFNLPKEAGAPEPIELSEEGSGEGETCEEGSDHTQSGEERSSSSSGYSAPRSSLVVREVMPLKRRNLIRDDDDDADLAMLKKQRGKEVASDPQARAGAELEKKKEEGAERRERERKREEDERMKEELRTKKSQSFLVPDPALVEGRSVALNPQLAPVMLGKAVLAADRERSSSMGPDQLALKADQGLTLFLSDYTVLRKNHDDLTRRNSELENAAKTSEQALGKAKYAAEWANKELDELRSAFAEVLASKLSLAEEKNDLVEKVKQIETEALFVREAGYNEGWSTAYEDVDAQIDYISRAQFKKGWDKALLAAGNSPLFDMHDPGPNPIVDKVSPARAAADPIAAAAHPPSTSSGALVDGSGEGIAATEMAEQLVREQFVDLDEYIPSSSRLGQILGPDATDQARRAFAKVCKALCTRYKEYKDQTEVVARLKDRLEEIEAIGSSVQGELDIVKAKLLEAIEINQVGELLQQENEALRREGARLREHTPNSCPFVVQGSASAPRAVVVRPRREAIEIEEDVRRAYVIAAGLQRDMTRLRHLFAKGPRQVWADGYDQGWTDAPTRLKELEELAFIKGWLNALREMKVPKNSALWYRHELSSSFSVVNPFRRDDYWIPLDAIPKQLLEAEPGVVEEELAPHLDDGHRAAVAAYLSQRPSPA